LAATNRANEIPIYENSHREHDANIVGALGEVVAEAWFRENDLEVLDERDKTTHDYLFASGVRVDVKTKDRTVPPRAYYDCSVPLYNHEHQRPDFYVFVSLQRPKHKSSDASSFTDAYLLGMTDQATLNDIGVIWKADQTDERNNTTFWTDCINIEVQQLIAPEDAVKKLR